MNKYNNYNNITLIKGKAGSGKSLLSLAFAFHMIFEKSIFDKIVAIINPLNTRNSAKIGFVPGSRIEKLSESFIGNMLISKIGDREEMFKLIDNNKLDILPIGDIRGYETGEKTIFYIPEAQNFDINLMKLALTRVGEGTKVIIDGDIDSQVDLDAFDGLNNGMRRASNIFKGEKVYSEVELKTIYRSEIAKIADKM
jgi:predicted ribonuclease YlaK